MLQGLLAVYNQALRLRHEATGDPRYLVPGGAERQLIYRNWVESRRAYVDEISGGRLGYIDVPMAGIDWWFALDLNDGSTRGRPIPSTIELCGMVRLASPR